MKQTGWPGRRAGSAARGKGAVGGLTRHVAGCGGGSTWEVGDQGAVLGAGEPEAAGDGDGVGVRVGAGVGIGPLPGG